MLFVHIDEGVRVMRWYLGLSSLLIVVICCAVVPAGAATLRTNATVNAGAGFVSVGPGTIVSPGVKVIAMPGNIVTLDISAGCTATISPGQIFVVPPASAPCPVQAQPGQAQSVQAQSVQAQPIQAQPVQQTVVPASTPAAPPTEGTAAGAPTGFGTTTMVVGGVIIAGGAVAAGLALSGSSDDSSSP